MKVIFTGDPIELARNESLSRMTTTLFGVDFPMGAERDVSHLSDQQKRKLLTNPHFRAAGVDAPAAPLIIPASAVAPAAAEAADEVQADADEDAATAAHADRAAKRKK